MATAYHMEALRKQRILERAVEAKQRMQVRLQVATCPTTVATTGSG